MLGYEYLGIDLRQEQVEANKANCKEVLEDISKVNYIVGDSKAVLPTLEPSSFDMAFTCPPYYDLEVYSDSPQDISNMDWQDFQEAYADILGSTVRLLKDDSFFVIVVGDIRDKNGNYRRLPSLAQSIMQANGLSLYNDIVYLTPVGSASIRVSGQFEASRKVCSVHQYFQVYIKGNARIATKKIKEEL